MKNLLILLLLSLFVFANEDNAYEKVDCNLIEPEVQTIIDNMALLLDSEDKNKEEILLLYGDLNYYAVESIKCDEAERLEVLNAHKIVTDILLQIGYIK